MRAESLKGRDRGSKEKEIQLLEIAIRILLFPTCSTSQTSSETEEKADGIAEYLENIPSQHVVLWKKRGVVRYFMTWKNIWKEHIRIPAINHPLRLADYRDREFRR